MILIWGNLNTSQQVVLDIQLTMDARLMQWTTDRQTTYLGSCSLVALVRWTLRSLVHMTLGFSRWTWKDKDIDDDKAVCVLCYRLTYIFEYQVLVTLFDEVNTALRTIKFVALNLHLFVKEVLSTRLHMLVVYWVRLFLFTVATSFFAFWSLLSHD